MVKRNGLWCFFLCILLSLTLVRSYVISPIGAYSEPFEETCNISFKPNDFHFFVNVLIPPDASVVSCTLAGTSGNLDNVNFTYQGCFNLRCYKFAQASLAIESSDLSSVALNISVKVNRNTVQYVSCSNDELADTILQRLKSHPYSSTFTPSLFFVNLNNSDAWRGYPVLSVNKNLSYQLPTQNVDYLIIGSIDKFMVLYDLMLFKSQQGLNVFFMSTEDIESNYIGSSIQYKTIEFLKDAFSMWHMKYVLLVGNNATLPPISYTAYNLLLGGTPTNVSLTGDYYYSTLEQPANDFSYTWPNRACLDFPDFILGRFPFDDITQIANLINKTIDYETNTNPGDWVRTNLIVAGEDAPGSTLWQCENYTTDRPKNRLLYPGNLSIQSLADEINNRGAGSILILTHGSPAGFYIGNGTTFSYNEVNLLNNSKLPVIFTIGCHTGKFDVGTSGSQSVAVSLLAKQNSGAVTIVSGTSFTPYGHYVYFSAYNYWNNTPVLQWRIPDANYEVGKAFYYFCALNPIEYMILLGDPALQIATANYDLPPEPTPSPAPTPTMRPIPTPTPTPSTQQTSTLPTPSPSPSQKPTQTPQPTPTPSQTPNWTATPTPTSSSDSGWFSKENSILYIIVAAVTVTVALVAVKLKRLKSMSNHRK